MGGLGEMSTFSKHFVSADEYEEWLRGAGERISVLSITNPGQSVFKPRQLWIRNPGMPSEVAQTSSAQHAAITVKYQTNDQTLVPRTSKNAKLVQVALVAGACFALFILAIFEL
jgi:hypothetical protein